MHACPTNRMHMTDPITQILFHLTHLLYSPKKDKRKRKKYKTNPHIDTLFAIQIRNSNPHTRSIYTIYIYTAPFPPKSKEEEITSFSLSTPKKRHKSMKIK